MKRAGFLVFLCAAGCEEKGAAGPKAEERPLAGKKVLMVIARDGFRDEELVKPRALFERLGAEVTVASSGAGECKGMLGARVTAGKALSEVEAATFDAVVFVGGVGAKEFFDDARAHELARGAKVLGAICLAPAILARAGVLKDRDATAYASALPELKKAGARVSEKAVVVDGHLVTGNGPKAAEEFAERLVEVIAAE